MASKIIRGRKKKRPAALFVARLKRALMEAQDCLTLWLVCRYPASSPWLIYIPDSNLIGDHCSGTALIYHCRPTHFLTFNIVFPWPPLQVEEMQVEEMQRQLQARIKQVAELGQSASSSHQELGAALQRARQVRNWCRKA